MSNFSVPDHNCKSTPAKSSISEAEQAELEEFIHNARILVNTLGHKVFEPLAETSNTSNNAQLFYVSAGCGKAKGLPTSDGFVLLKGSSIHDKPADSLRIGIREKVDDSRENRQIIDNVLREDMLFSSSSASAFAVGYNIGGPRQWKTQNNQTLKSFETCKE